MSARGDDFGGKNEDISSICPKLSRFPQSLENFPPTPAAFHRLPPKRLFLARSQNITVKEIAKDWKMWREKDAKMEILGRF